MKYTTMRQALWAAIACFASARALAVPPPKTDEELFEMSDLVVDAEGTDVTCEGPPVADAEKTVTTYRSRLQVLKTYKGDSVETFEILGQEIVWNGMPPMGGWHQEPVARGFVGKFYLERLPDGTFTKVWWNAIQEDAAKSHPEPLPSCGEQNQDAGPADDARLPEDAGPDSDGSSGPALSERGCGCRASVSPSPATVPFGLLLLGLLLARPPRRR